jgi:hypothetical protein
VKTCLLKEPPPLSTHSEHKDGEQSILLTTRIIGVKEPTDFCISKSKGTSYNSI